MHGGTDLKRHISGGVHQNKIFSLIKAPWCAFHMTKAFRTIWNISGQIAWESLIIIIKFHVFLQGCTLQVSCEPRNKHINPDQIVHLLTLLSSAGDRFMLKESLLCLNRLQKVNFSTFSAPSLRGTAPFVVPMVWQDSQFDFPLGSFFCFLLVLTFKSGICWKVKQRIQGLTVLLIEQLPELLFF